MSARLGILVFRLLLVSDHFSALICQPGETVPIQLRLDAAKAAIAYERPRLSPAGLASRRTRSSSMIWPRELSK
jgi:hypothetical protein